MKPSIILTLFMIQVFSIAFSQESGITAIIPRDYGKAEHFFVLDKGCDTISEFHRAGKKVDIMGKMGISQLLQRKYLVENMDTVAIYKKKSILFPERKVEIREKNIKNGWEYYEGDQLVVKVGYEFDKKKDCYHAAVFVKTMDTQSRQVVKICLGKFDKRVIMDYDDDNYYMLQALITGAIIGIIVANN